MCQIADVTQGEFVHKNKMTEDGEYPVYNGGRTPTGYYHKYNKTGNKILISSRGASAGYVNIMTEKYWSGNSCYSIEITDKNMDFKFVYYCIKNNEKNLLDSQQKGGIPAVSKPQVDAMLIPVPPLEIQQQIVEQLDKLDTLVNSITEGLPKEIELRQKQYEYYRDKLLTFKEI